MSKGHLFEVKPVGRISDRTIEGLDFNNVYAAQYGTVTPSRRAFEQPIFGEAFMNEARRGGQNLSFKGSAQVESELSAKRGYGVNINVKPGVVPRRRITGCQAAIAAANAMMNGVYAAFNEVFNSSILNSMFPEEDKAGSLRRLDETHARIAVRVSQAGGDGSVMPSPFSTTSRGRSDGARFWR